MPWREALEPVRMDRIAVVGLADRMRDVLVHVADVGVVELDRVPVDSPSTEAAHHLQRITVPAGTPASLSRSAPDLDVLESQGRADLLAGEAELQERLVGAVHRGQVAAVAGWAPSAALVDLSERLAPVGASVVRLPVPPGTDPPTLLVAGSRLRRSLTPLVETYATVPYADVDPTVLASLAYVAMFGMMFGDVGQGLLLVLVGLYLASGASQRRRALARVRGAWPFVVGAGVASMAVGFLYGEFFGPTGVVPTLWVDPLEEPVQVLAAAVGVGAVLLAGAYAVGTVNRFREGGWPLALYAPTGVAGAALFVGLAALALGVLAGWPWAVGTGVVVWVAGLALVFGGLWASAGGRLAGAAQAVVELFDTVVRLGSNLVSFARLAAFGLTHAAIGAMVWAGTTALWGRGVLDTAAALALFVVGTALAFSLEALVAAVQALRLEYYELFSRVFAGEGRPFQPWHLPTAESADPGSEAVASTTREEQ